MPPFKGRSGQEELEELISCTYITKNFQRSFYSIYTLKCEPSLELNEGKQHENYFFSI